MGNNKMDSLIERIGEKKLIFIWGLLCSFAVLLFTTRSSILYICNNWDDANSYFSVGKAFMNGTVLYRDIYDQKGPFLYLLYGVAYLISNKSFFGVFIFEIIAGGIVLYLAGLVIRRHSNIMITAVLLPVLSASIYSSWSFYWGGAAEEMCLPFLAYGIYVTDGILNDYYDKSKLSGAVIRVGLCAGVVAQVKYTMLGFFAAFWLIAFIYAVRKYDIKTAMRNGLLFIGCAIIPSIPWLIYFVATGSLDDWYRCYIYNNIFFYSQVSDESYSLMYKFYEMAKTLYWLIRDSWTYFIWVIAGFVLQLFMGKKMLHKIAYVFMFACTYIVIFIGGNTLAYYSIPLMVFAIPGIAYVGSLIYKIMSLERLKLVTEKLLNLRYVGVVAAALSIIVLLASTSFAASNTMNAEYRQMKSEDMWLVQITEYLDEDDTLLNMNTIDAGAFTVTGIIPTCEYFQTNGINLETMFTEQARYIEEGVTEYVLAVLAEPENIYNNYELVTTFVYEEPNHEKIYYLYKLKD